MSHPTRHRITLALREPMTVSALARELGINKGNVAHHVAVLERVGLVRRVGTQTGRGGTGTLYGSAPLSLAGRSVTTAMLRAIDDGISSDPDAFAYLRSVRLTAEQARQVAAQLEHLVATLPPVPGAKRRQVFVSLSNA